MTGTTDLPVPIEEKHGADCICTEVGRIDLTLVAANRACPGDRNPARGSRITATLDDTPPADYPGRGITITWPETKGNGYPLASWPMQIHDHDTGEQLLAVSGLRIVLGGDDWDGKLIQADLTMLVNADGAPLGNGERAVPIDDGRRAKTGVFRAYVVEMRTRPVNPTIPTRESVNRGEHSVNQYREYYGIVEEHTANMGVVAYDLLMPPPDPGYWPPLRNRIPRAEPRVGEYPVGDTSDPAAAHAGPLES